MKIKITTRLFHFTKTLVCFLLLFASSVYAQDPPQYGTPYAGVPDTRDVNMYQVHIRPFSANGDLAGVTAQLDNIKALGTNVIFTRTALILKAQLLLIVLKILKPLDQNTVHYPI